MPDSAANVRRQQRPLLVALTLASFSSLIIACLFPHARILAADQAAQGAEAIQMNATEAKSGEAETPAKAATAVEQIQFNRDIRPILSDKCYACHGPDENTRKAGLRLDLETGALADLGGYAAVVPGNIDDSELVRRILSKDPAEQMPPPKHPKRLTAAEQQLLTEWVKQGAKWEGHWAWIAPTRPAVPDVADSPWPRNEIDRFILSRLQGDRQQPSPEADRRTLARRLSLDLTGLPPGPDEVEAFVNDQDPRAYERLVERLLTSPHFGERMAIYWLDLVRFADTAGYHSDNPRNIAPYRDYVIDAFNDNLPFDRFTVEQIAGDLLPEPTVSQQVASGYNRLLQTTEEGGAQAKEYEAIYFADRVRNFSTVWMGSTMGCAQCHDHKFDPFTMKDFYSLAAFFADVREAPIGRREPGIMVPSDSQTRELAELETTIAALKTALATTTPELAAAQTQWEQSFAASPAAGWQPLTFVSGKAMNESPVKLQDDGSLLAEKAGPQVETVTLSFKTAHKQIAGLRLDILADKQQDKPIPAAEFNLSSVTFGISDTANAMIKPVELSGVSASFGRKTGTEPLRRWSPLPIEKQPGSLNFKVATAEQVGQEHRLLFALKQPLETTPETILTVTLRQMLPANRQSMLGRIRISAVEQSVPPADRGLAADDILALTQIEAAQRPADQAQLLAAHYREIAPLLDPVRARLAETERRQAELTAAIPRSLISVSINPVTMRIKPRGNWMDESGEVVTAAVPTFLPRIETTAGKVNRLDLARWLIAPENPLTARVFVNRLWKLYLGQGLSKSLEDLGSQGEWPTHPELLDWLAVEFRESGWDVKHMVRLIVNSATYRQTSVPSAMLRESDPYNRLLGRQGRFRLDAELIRDNALAVSGLLVAKVGGASAKPYQPEGYWTFLNFPRRDYPQDHGENLYRRSLYTHWQRSFLHPTLLTFDAPSREECVADRPRSNTPQQALVLLNDPVYVEAARVFAEKILRHGGADVPARLQWAFARALSRPPQAQELDVLVQLYQGQLTRYQADRAAADKLIRVGEYPVPEDLDRAEHAAWTAVARTLLNLHETITRY